MDPREVMARVKEMRHELAELRKMWSRQVRPLPDTKGILEAAQGDTAEADNIGRYVKDRTEEKVNNTKWKQIRHLKGFEYGEVVKNIPNICIQ